MGATIGAGAASSLSGPRSAQAVKAFADGQRPAALEDSRNSDEAPPRQLGAARRGIKGRKLIDGISGFCARLGFADARNVAAFVPHSPRDRPVRYVTSCRDGTGTTRQRLYPELQGQQRPSQLQSRLQTCSHA
jgi:hypothetical protein